MTLKASNRCKRIDCIASKPWEWLCENEVDFSFKSVSHHSVEALSSVIRKTRNAIIVVNLYELPLRIFKYVLLIKGALIYKAALLLLRCCWNTCICRHITFRLFPRQRYKRRDEGDLSYSFFTHGAPLSNSPITGLYSSVSLSRIIRNSSSLMSPKSRKFKSISFPRRFLHPVFYLYRYYSFFTSV